MVILDNFHPRFDEHLDYAENAEYKDSEYDGRTYFYIHELDDQESVELLGEKLGLKLNGWTIMRKGHNPTGWIHADTNCGNYAGVLYFKDTEKVEGTAFWRHKKYGENLTSDMTQSQIDEINGDCNDESKWDLLYVVQAKANRMLAFNGNRFHSVYPKLGPQERIVECLFMSEDR